MQVGVDVKCMHTNFGGRSSFSFRVMTPFCLPSKTTKIPFWTMDYSPWSSKKLVAWNWLKKFMQVGVDVKCMHTNFGGRSSSGFGVMTPFFLPSKMAKKINYINYVIAINASLQCLVCTHAYTSSVELEPCTILCYLFIFLLTCNCSHVVKWWSESDTIASVQ